MKDNLDQSSDQNSWHEVIEDIDLFGVGCKFGPNYKMMDSYLMFIHYFGFSIHPRYSQWEQRLTLGRVMASLARVIKLLSLPLIHSISKCNIIRNRNNRLPWPFERNHRCSPGEIKRQKQDEQALPRSRPASGSKNQQTMNPMGPLDMTWRVPLSGLKALAIMATFWLALNHCLVFIGYLLWDEQKDLFDFLIEFRLVITKLSSLIFVLVWHHDRYKIRRLLRLIQSTSNYIFQYYGSGGKLLAGGSLPSDLRGQGCPSFSNRRDSTAPPLGYCRPPGMDNGRGRGRVRGWGPQLSEHRSVQLGMVGNGAGEWRLKVPFSTNSQLSTARGSSSSSIDGQYHQQTLIQMLNQNVSRGGGRHHQEHHKWYCGTHHIHGVEATGGFIESEQKSNDGQHRRAIKTQCIRDNEKTVVMFWVMSLIVTGFHFLLSEAEVSSSTPQHLWTWLGDYSFGSMTNKTTNWSTLMTLASIDNYVYTVHVYGARLIGSTVICLSCSIQVSCLKKLQQQIRFISREYGHSQAITTSQEDLIYMLDDSITLDEGGSSSVSGCQSAGVDAIGGTDCEVGSIYEPNKNIGETYEKIGKLGKLYDQQQKSVAPAELPIFRNKSNLHKRDHRYHGHKDRSYAKFSRLRMKLDQLTSKSALARQQWPQLNPAHCKKPKELSSVESQRGSVSWQAPHGLSGARRRSGWNQISDSSHHQFSRLIDSELDNRFERQVNILANNYGLISHVNHQMDKCFGPMMLIQFSALFLMSCIDVVYFSLSYGKKTKTQSYIIISGMILLWWPHLLLYRYSSSVSSHSSKMLKGVNRMFRQVAQSSTNHYLTLKSSNLFGKISLTMAGVTQIDKFFLLKFARIIITFSVMIIQLIPD